MCEFIFINENIFLIFIFNNILKVYFFLVCPLNINLASLSSAVECSLDASCLNIDCCIYVTELNRRFSYTLHVDDCKYQLSASIENLLMERKLSAFEFGKLLL